MGQHAWIGEERPERQAKERTWEIRATVVRVDQAAPRGRQGKQEEGKERAWRDWRGRWEGEKVKTQGRKSERSPQGQRQEGRGRGSEAWERQKQGQTARGGEGGEGGGQKRQVQESEKVIAQNSIIYTFPIKILNTNFPCFSHKNLLQTIAPNILPNFTHFFKVIYAYKIVYDFISDQNLGILSKTYSV